MKRKFSIICNYVVCVKTKIERRWKREDYIQSEKNAIHDESEHNQNYHKNQFDKFLINMIKPIFPNLI